MSYAAVASKGPKQSPEEARAPALPVVEHSETESSVASLIDVDSPHVSSVPSTFSSQEIKTSTQAERKEHEKLDQDLAQAKRDAQHEAVKAANKAEAQVSQNTEQTKQKAEEVKEDAKSTAQDVKSKAEQVGRDVKAKAEEVYEDVKPKAQEAKEDVKAKANRAADLADKNKDNPVIVGNAVAMTVIAAGLAIGGYRKYASNELTWKVAGTWAGVVGLLAVGDVYLSKYFFQQYPPKK